MTDTTDTDLNVKAATRTILEQIAARGEEIPSLRTVRGMIGGKGSLTTISEEIAAWRDERVQTQELNLPEGFGEEATRKMLDTLWTFVRPVMVAQAEAARREADERIRIQREEATKIRSAAAEILAEAEGKENERAELMAKVISLQSQVDSLQGALEEARAQLAQRDAKIAEKDAIKDEALQRAATATAELQSTTKLLPLLDPKQLERLSKPMASTEQKSAPAKLVDAAPKREKPKAKLVTTVEPEQEVTPPTQGEQVKTTSRSKSGRTKAKQQPLASNGQ